jgi:hypothetical protein
VTGTDTDDYRAHQLAPRGGGEEALGTLCGLFAEPGRWAPAPPGAERCQDCQLEAAGPAPD